MTALLNTLVASHPPLARLIYDANIQWARSFVNDLQPYSDGSRYLNFAGFQEEGNVMMQNAYGQQYARLAALKRKYDPDNLFRLNANVKPMAQATA